MGRKRKLPHWREAARAALEAKAREGDPKAIKLLESSFEGKPEEVVDSRPIQELRAIMALTFPGFASEEEPASVPELRASWQILRARALYLEELVEALDARLAVATCPSCSAPQPNPLDETEDLPGDRDDED